MRKVIVAEFISLDGYIAGPKGEMDWAMVEPSDLKPEWDTILLGRVTYELWAGFWPTANVKENPLADFINTAPKVVFSKTMDSAPWGKWKNARLVKDKIPEVVQELKREKGGNMAILGSANLVQSFANLGLVDEYLLLVFPVILGSGKMLFRNIADRQDLKLVEATASRTGVATLRYRSGQAGSRS